MIETTFVISKNTVVILFPLEYFVFINNHNERRHHNYFVTNNFTTFKKIINHFPYWRCTKEEEKKAYVFHTLTFKLSPWLWLQCLMYILMQSRSFKLFVSFLMPNYSCIHQLYMSLIKYFLSQLTFEKFETMTLIKDYD